MTDQDIEITDDSVNESEDGKFNLDDLPDEEGEKDKKEDKKTPDKSEIAQKLKWRDKYKQIRAELDEYKKASDKKHEETGVPADDKEKAAWDAIDKRIRDVLKTAREEEKASEKQAERAFQDKLDEALEDYPEFSETEILDICEEFECTPDRAVKILQRQAPKEKKKPGLPQPKRSTAEPQKHDAEKDKGKSIFDIANDVKRELKERLGK